MNIGKIEWTNKTYLYINMYNVHVRYQQHSFLPMFEIEMVLAFSKLSHQKEIQPRKKKVPCSSSGFQSYLKGKENHVKCDSSWNRTNLKKITWNVKVPEKVNFWTRIASNVKVPEEENYWREIASNMMVPKKDKSENISSHQMWKFLNWNMSEKKSHHIW